MLFAKAGLFSLVTHSRTTIPSLLFMSMFALSGCLSSGGGSDSGGEDDEQEASPPSTDQDNLNQALLGALAGASVEILELSDPSVVLEGPLITDDTPDLERAGTFSVDLPDVADEDWVLVAVSGGTDLDPKDMGELSDTPLPNDGTFYGIAQADALRTGDVRITPLSDMIYHLLNTDADLATLENEDIVDALQELAELVLEKPVHGEDITYEDVLAFHPVEDRGSTQFSWGAMLAGAVNAIRQGRTAELRNDHYSLLIPWSSIEELEVQKQSVGQESISTATDEDGATRLIQHEEFQEEARVLTTLERSVENERIGTTTVTLNGRNVTITFPVEDDDLFAATTETLLETGAIRVEVQDVSDTQTLTLDLPSELIPSWDAAAPIVEVDGEIAEVTVLEDNPTVLINTDADRRFDTVLVELLEADDTRCLAYDEDLYRSGGGCVVADLGTAWVMVVPPDTVDQLQGPDGLEATLSLLSLADTVGDLSAVASGAMSWQAAIPKFFASNAFLWSTSRTDLMIATSEFGIFPAEEQNDAIPPEVLNPPGWLAPNQEYYPVLMHRSARLRNWNAWFGLDSPIIDPRSGLDDRTWVEPEVLQDPAFGGRVRLQTRSHTGYVIIGKNPLELTGGTQSDVSMQARGGSWIFGDRTSFLRYDPFFVLDPDLDDELGLDGDPETIGGEACTDYGMCGLEFMLAEDIDITDLSLSVSWGDNHSLGKMTLQECLDAGVCKHAGGQRYRLWHRYDAGEFEGELQLETGSGFESSVSFTVAVDQIQNIDLQAETGDGSVTLDWDNLPADQYNLCVAESPVTNIGNCLTEGGQPIEVDVGVPPFVASGLTEGTEYFFRVEGQFGSERILSNQVVATPQDSAPPDAGISGALNDTGIDWCADGATNYDSGDSVLKRQNCDIVAVEYPGQDGMHGRDAQARDGGLEKVGDGAAGFDYTKLDADGSDLPASATEWTCVRDNHTGLTWEVKTDDGGLRDQDHTYTWYQPDGPNMGDPGVQDGGSCSGSACDTHSFAQAVNAERLCGADDWRLPTVDELHSLSHLGQTGPAIDTDFFPNTRSSLFWSASPSAGRSDFAWIALFSNGRDFRFTKSFSSRVRLVRGGQ